MRNIASLAWAILVGCSVPPAPLLTIPQGHPASAESQDTRYVPPDNPLKSEPVPAPAAEPKDPHEHHGGHGQAEKKEYPLDVCVVSGEKLGSMGEPVVLQHEGREVRLCCPGCIDKFKAEPAKYLKKLDDAAKNKHEQHGEPR